MTIRKLSILLGSLFFFSFASPLLAAPTLDQSYIPSSTNSAGIAAGSTVTEFAQTFTVGLAGNLSRVDLDIFRASPNSTGNVLLDIRDVDPSGHPNNTLRSLSIPGTTLPVFNPTFVTFDFSTNPLPVLPGQMLALVMHESAGNFQTSWAIDSAASDPYSDGSAQFQIIPSFPWAPIPGIASNSDFGFKIFVEVPEPATAFFLFAAAPLFLRRRSLHP